MTHDAPVFEEAPSDPGTPRRLLVVGAALLLLLAVRALKVDVGVGVTDSLTLASCGFVLLAAFTVGELGVTLGLPKVTGYILAGVVVGPQVANLLSDRVVSDLSTVNTLTLGLIAISAGLELDIRAIRRVVPTLAATVGAKLVLLPLLVGVPLYFAERQLSWFDLQGSGELLAFALVFSVLCIGTSPAIALAVVNDTGAKGRLTDLLLAMAVVKDVVVVVSLAVAVAVSHTWIGGGAFHADVVWELGRELGGSVAAGIVVGGLFVAWFRYVGAEPLFTALVAILLVGEATRYLHLELLLLFIVAGFVVRNFSPYEHALLTPIERIALPVFVVFFTVAGAGIDLRGTLAILPFALGLCAMRALVFWLGARVGARVGGEEPPVGKNAWLTYLPQAGVTLGLVLLASAKLPELAEPITRLGMAMVGLNLLVGPVTMMMGLRRAGETADAQLTVEGTPVPEAGPLVEEGADGLHASLADPLEGLRSELDRRSAAFVTSTIHPHAAALEARGQLLTGLGDVSRAPEIRAALDAGVPWVRGALDQEAATLFDVSSAALRSRPWSLEVPLDEEATATRPSDGRATRLRQWVARVGARLTRLRGRIPVRRVPMQLVVRRSVEPRLAEAILGVTSSFYRAEAEILAASITSARGGSSDPPDLAGIATRWAHLAEHELGSALRLGLAEAAGQLAIAGGPRLPSRQLRFADVEPRIAAALDTMRHDTPRWIERISAVEETVRAAIRVEGFVTTLRASLDAHASRPLATCRDLLLPTVDEALERLVAVTDALDAGPDVVLAALDAVVTPSLSSRLHLAADRFRRATQPAPVVADIAEVVRNAPEELVVVTRQVPLHSARSPNDAAVRTIRFADRIDTVLRDELLPAIEAALAPVSELVTATEGRLREAVRVARYGAEVAAQGVFTEEPERRAVVVDAGRRALRQLEVLDEQLAEAFLQAETELALASERAVAGLRGASSDPGRGTAARTMLRAGTDVAQRAWNKAAIRGRALQAATRSLSGQRALVDLKLRSGHQRLDAVGIRQYLDTWLAPPESRGVPSVYVRLMSSSPVTERRMFVARTALLERLLDGLSASPQDHAPSTLVVGPEGAGRTSLLNMVKSQLVGSRILWIEPAFSTRDGGPLRALATELGTVSDPGAVAEALRREPTVVLFDDLHTWVEPTAAGLAELDAWSRVLDRTADHTRWLVSMEAAALDLFDEAIGLARVFRRVVHLPPLDWRELRAIFGQREQLGGFDTDYRARGPRARLLDRIRLGSRQDSYFRTLARLSGGNPGAASAIHLHAVEVDGDRLRAGVPSRPDLPFLARQGDDVLALLALLARFGPMEPRWLAVVLSRSEAQVERHLIALVHAGLLEDRRPGARRVAIPLRLAPSVRRELMDLGVATGVA